ncbi:MAG: DinB family protein [Chitinophagaceae bacterium]|nr:DinB family protein [Chitinophagaceae bacterium]
MISRNQVSVPEPYLTYLNKAGADELPKALTESTKRFKKLVADLPKKKIDYAYAEGKWTIKQLLQHIIDAERVFAFRAVWFSRNDPSPQPGFDENNWAASTSVGDRKWKVMIQEFLLLREANALFFESLSDEQLQRTGTSNNVAVSTVGFGFISAGHLNHHIDIIEERYLNKQSKKNKVV